MPNVRWFNVLPLLLAACQPSGSDPFTPIGAERDDVSPEVSPPSEGAGSAVVSEARPAPQAGAPGDARPSDPPMTSVRVAAAGAGAPQDLAAQDSEPEAADDVDLDALDERDEPEKVAEAVPEDTVVQDTLQRSAWDEFKERSSHVADGSVYYVVEWDIPIHTESELRAYYDAMVAGEQDKGVVFQLPMSTIDDVWQGFDHLTLRYCVDTNTTTGFGAASSQVSAATMIAAMDEATRAWERVANVRFEYDPSRNNNCGIAASVPDTTYFKVARSDTLATVFAFAPSGQTAPGLDGRTIGVPSQYINSLAPPGFTWPGTMMHELGHVLGFAHEHFHTNGGDCTSPSAARDVTPVVDLFSIMGYPKGVGGTPACALTTPNLTALSFLDGWTARFFYGAPPAWQVVIESPLLE